MKYEERLPIKIWVSDDESILLNDEYSDMVYDRCEALDMTIEEYIRAGIDKEYNRVLGQSGKEINNE